MKPHSPTKGLSRFARHRLRATPPTSLSDKENADVTTISTSEGVDSSLGDCYAFIEDDLKSKGSTLLKKDERKALSQSAATLSNSTHKPTQMKSLTKCNPSEPNIASRRLTRSATANSTTDARGRQDQYQSKKPTRCAGRGRKRGKASHRQKNAAAGSSENSSSMSSSPADSITMTDSVGADSVTKECGEERVDTHKAKPALEQRDSDMKDESACPLSEQEVCDMNMANGGESSSASCGEVEVGDCSGKQTTTIVASAVTMEPVYQESQIMVEPLSWLSNPQGNVESGGCTPDSGKLSHAPNTVANGDGDSADSSFLSGVLGNLITDSTPTLNRALASRSPTASTTRTDSCHFQESSSQSSQELKTDNSPVSNSDKQLDDGYGRRGITRRGRRGRGGRRKGDPNESWIRTNSQPQTSSHVGDLELSQSEVISSSLPDRGHHGDEFSLLDGTDSNRGSRNIVGTRASKRRQRGSGERMSNGVFSGRMTRSRTAALQKSNTDADEEEMQPSSSDPKKDVDLPPTKKPKPKHSDPITFEEELVTEHTILSDSATVTAGSSLRSDAVCESMSGSGESVVMCSVTGATTVARPATNTKQTGMETCGTGIGTCDAGMDTCQSGMETPPQAAATDCVSEVTKSSSPSPRFAQCSSSISSQPPNKGQTSTKMVCLYWFTW